jgi:uncharacterized protein (DUF488 family)
MPKKIYTAGYQNFDRDRLVRFLLQINGVLVDIRQSPYSRKAEWNRNRLEVHLGKRYAHIQEFGNINYNNGLPIQIGDYATGLTKLITYQQPVVLLCACRDYATCHRHTLADMLRRDGFNVQEWDGEIETEQTGQASLFDLMGGSK